MKSKILVISGWLRSSIHFDKRFNPLRINDNGDHSLRNAMVTFLYIYEGNERMRHDTIGRHLYCLKAEVPASPSGGAGTLLFVWNKFLFVSVR